MELTYEELWFISANVWAIIFGLWYAVSEKDSKLIISVRPTKRPPDEAFKQKD